MRYFLFFAFMIPLVCAQAVQDLPTIESPRLKDPKEIIPLQLQSLDHLRTMTKNTLVQIEALQASITKYQAVQELYLQHPNDKELLQRMTKMAHNLILEIKKTNLGHAIDPDFLKELKLLDKIYQKMN